MNLLPLSDDELDAVNGVLLAYGNDDSCLDVSELDGFLTAIVSGPEVVLPSAWFPALWGGADKEPRWRDPQEAEWLFGLLVRHINTIAWDLMYAPAEFEALFNITPKAEGDILVVGEWCFGYMRGVDLGAWPGLPAEQAAHLEAIALHGRKENFDKLETMSLQEHQATAREVEPAARALHAYWLGQRSSEHSPVRSDKTGRNSPCPCGSGKKFKHCCLH